jgi:hypothetical protein
MSIIPLLYNKFVCFSNLRVHYHTSSTRLQVIISYKIWNFRRDMIWWSLLGLPVASEYLKSMMFRGLTTSPSVLPDDGDGVSPWNVIVFKYSDATGSPRRLHHHHLMPTKHKQTSNVPLLNVGIIPHSF